MHAGRPVHDTRSLLCCHPLLQPVLVGSLEKGCNVIAANPDTLESKLQSCAVHRQRHHGAREVFLGRGTTQAPAECLLRPVPVVTRRAFAEAPPANNDVLVCDYLYDDVGQARAWHGAVNVAPGGRRASAVFCTSSFLHEDSQDEDPGHCQMDDISKARRVS